MKREKGVKQCLKLLFTALLFVMVLTTGVKAQAATWVEINQKNFPDSRVRKELKSNASYNENYKCVKGKYYVNVTGVTRFDYSIYDGGGITNFDFLNKFPRLESVQLQNVNVTRIDLSKNTKLKEIYILNAPRLVSIKCPKSIQSLSLYGTNISRLDTKGLQNLTNLKVRCSIKLKMIDVSGNKKLESIDVGGSSLRSVDVRKCKRLTSLNCYGEKVTDLKIGKNTKLKNISVYNNKNLTDLDISQCPNLESIYASNTGITEFDTSKYRNLQTLSLSGTAIKTLDVTKCPKLNMLYVADTAIKNLNVTKCYKLSYLDVSNTSIKTLNVTKNKNLWGVAASGNKKLKRLNVTQCPKLNIVDISGSGISYINLTRNKKLTTFAPSNTRMKVAGLKGRTNLSLTYYGLKKGSVVPLKDIIGSGYKLSEKNKNIRFNPKTMKFQILRKSGDRDQLFLKKGNSRCDINIRYTGK